eukprot:TRINITY_DN927_c1_g1_i1.p1 TRINITY_DN927_c1_g1~~TRINITY_DN927_c1_g1_i1.p1  ORF type:complete len:426 (+),score=122.73 TRINITY_DN927_c1_g1_i1:74-1351(+)
MKLTAVLVLAAAVLPLLVMLSGSLGAHHIPDSERPKLAARNLLQAQSVGQARLGNQDPVQTEVPRAPENTAAKVVAQPVVAQPEQTSEVDEESRRASAAQESTKFGKKEDYVDCAGRPFAKLLEAYDRDGVVLFKPCSLHKNEALLDSIVKYINKQCGRVYLSNSCHNRLWNAKNANITQLGVDDEVRQVIEWLHDGTRIYPFQTLNFKWGTRQPLHSDLIHFAGWPSMTMTAAWVALEDIHPDAGPLQYVLGSHKGEFRSMESLGCKQGQYHPCYENALQTKVIEPREKDGWKPVSVLPKKGEAAVWAANALHGGSPVKDQSDSLTRLSQVTHYMFEGNDFVFQPQTSHLTGDVSTSMFAIRQDIPAHAKADEVVARWKKSASGKDMKARFKQFWSTDALHDVSMNLIEPKVPRAKIYSPNYPR